MEDNDEPQQSDDPPKSGLGFRGDTETLEEDVVSHGIEFMQHLTSRFRNSQLASADEYPAGELKMKLKGALLKLSQVFTRSSRLYTPATIYHHLTTIHWASVDEDQEFKPLLDDIMKFGQAYVDQGHTPLALVDLRRAVLRYAIATAILAPDMPREPKTPERDPARLLQNLANLAAFVSDPQHHGDVELLEMICYLEKYDARRRWPDLLLACRRWGVEDDCAPGATEQILVQLRLLNLDVRSI